MADSYGMSERQIEDEMASRIAADFAHHGGVLPERTAVAWFGYIAALIEWGVISVAGHDRLFALLPEVADNPARDILLGRHADEGS